MTLVLALEVSTANRLRAFVFIALVERGRRRDRGFAGVVGMVLGVGPQGFGLGIVGEPVARRLAFDGQRQGDSGGGGRVRSAGRARVGRATGRGRVWVVGHVRFGSESLRVWSEKHLGRDGGLRGWNVERGVGVSGQAGFMKR